MSVLKLLNKPAIVGQTVDYGFVYNIEVPVPGFPLQEAFLGVTTQELVNLQEELLRTTFTINQNESLFNQVEWITVGYFEDPDTLDCTLYYQFRYPERKD